MTDELVYINFEVLKELFVLPALVTVQSLDNLNITTRQASGRCFRAVIDKMDEGPDKERVKDLYSELLKYCECDYSQDRPNLKPVD